MHGLNYSTWTLIWIIIARMCARSTSSTTPAQVVMKDPVVVSGVAYERSAIEAWLLDKGPVSPADGRPLESAAVVPDHTLRSLLAEVRGQL